MGKTIWDGFGRRIGSVSELPDGKKHVYDRNGQPLGIVGDFGTLDKSGRLISRADMPGLLFKRTRNTE